MSRYDMGHPPFFGPPWGFSRGPFQFSDQHYGLGMGMEHYFQPIIPFQCYNRYNRPWSQLTGGDSGKSSVVMDKDGFKMTVDVHNFKPEEVTVNQVEDSVVVEAKHEETEDEHGYASRHFVRRYVLPEGVDQHALNSTLSSDGVLTITAPNVKQMNEENVQTIPIKQTGKPAILGAEIKTTKR